MNVERCAIACCTETLPPRTVKDDEIFEALFVADYLDMQPAIKSLCG